MASEQTKTSETFLENIRQCPKLEQSWHGYKGEEFGLPENIPDIVDEVVEDGDKSQDELEKPLQDTHNPIHISESRRKVRRNSCSLCKWRNYIVFALILMAATAIAMTYLWHNSNPGEAHDVTSETSETAAQKMTIFKIEEAMPEMTMPTMREAMMNITVSKIEEAKPNMIMTENKEEMPDIMVSKIREALADMTISKIKEAMPGTVDLNIGMRQDFRLRDCSKNNMKESFPDFDYSLMGYNILHGFPLAYGHDPGFTYPIFIADYSTMGQSADCRYSIPEGFVVVPDVSCVTSFSSRTIQSSHEFSKELAVSANVRGGGWGVSFSASAGYKESSSEVSSGESVFILSTAQCNYYFSKIIQDEPPKFHKVFVDWIYKLNASIPNNKNTVFLNFLEIYGTHFPTMVTYGARYTYQHKMSSSTYKSELSKGINVAIQAGYSSIISVNGGFSLDFSQREAASNFQKNVETKTFTVGAAPPANGDAMTWASEVKDNPVPTKYDLSMISDLFTDQYMGNLGVDLDTIRKTLLEMMPLYCAHLKQEGQIDTCETANEGIRLKYTRLFNHPYKSYATDSELICLDQCIEEQNCDAMTFCLDCKSTSTRCLFYSDGQTYTFGKREGKVDGEDKWVTTILPSKIHNTLRIHNSVIEGVKRGSPKRVFTKEDCQFLCVSDKQCAAFSFCKCPSSAAFSFCKCKSKSGNCFLFRKSSITGLKEDPDYESYFMGTNMTINTFTTYMN